MNTFFGPLRTKNLYIMNKKNTKSVLVCKNEREKREHITRFEAPINHSVVLVLIIIKENFVACMEQTEQ